MKRKIASKVERLKRIHQVYQWVCKGWSTNKIVAQCHEDYGIGQSMSEKYLNRARELLCKRMESEMATQASDIVKKLDAIHERTFEKGETRYTEEGEPYQIFDHSTARQALMDKAKLLGLLTNKIDMHVTNERDEYPDFDAEELEDGLTAH